MKVIKKTNVSGLCSYIARPAVAVSHLSLSSTGKVVYTLKTSYRDGTTQVAFEPVDFIASWTALAPKPRVNLMRVVADVKAQVFAAIRFWPRGCSTAFSHQPSYFWVGSFRRTSMTDWERELVARWIDAGAPAQ